MKAVSLITFFGILRTAATEVNLMTACFVPEPQFDPSWNNHTIGDKFVFNNCIMTEYNKLMAPRYEITALASWDEVQVDYYIDAILQQLNATGTEGGVRQRRRQLRRKKNKKKKKGNGGSATESCDSSVCGDDYSANQGSHRGGRQLSASDVDAAGDVHALDFAVTVCLMDAKLEGYLQAYDMPNGVTLTSCVDEYIEED